MTLAPAVDRPPGTAHRVLRLMIPLMLVLFISNLDATVVATAIPSIGRSLHDLAGAPWIATAYLLTSAVTTLVLGKLGDMYGRKPVFQFSIAVFLAGSVLSGLASGMVWLVLFRGLQGIGGGGLNSLVMAIIGDVVPARQRSKYQAMVGGVATLALIAGPLAGGLFSEDLSWRWIFYINIPVGLAALVTVAAFLHLPAPRRAARVDGAGAALAAVFTTAALLAATWGGTSYAWGSPLILTLIGVSVASLAGYLAAERRAAEPLTPLSLFRSSVFSISVVQFLLATMVLFVAMLYVPSFLQTVQHKSAFTAGLYVIPLLVGLVAATAVAAPSSPGPAATSSTRSSAPSSPAPPWAPCPWPARTAAPRPSSSRWSSPAPGSACSSRSRCSPARTRSSIATWARPPAPSTSSSRSAVPAAPRCSAPFSPTASPPGTPSPPTGPCSPGPSRSWPSPSSSPC
jgi:MFS family permease